MFSTIYIYIYDPACLRPVDRSVGGAGLPAVADGGMVCVVINTIYIYIYIYLHIHIYIYIYMY